MNGNYEWVKFQTNDRIQKRMQEAEAHRLAKLVEGNRPAPPTAISIKTALVMGVGLFLAIWLLASCAPAEATTDTAAPAAQSTQSEAAVETAVAAIDPADQKFFNAGVSTAAGVTATVHPADRKFFNAGVSTAADVAATVHPADRKFFNATEGSTKTLLQPIPRH